MTCFTRKMVNFCFKHLLIVCCFIVPKKLDTQKLPIECESIIVACVDEVLGLFEFMSSTKKDRNLIMYESV